MNSNGHQINQMNANEIKLSLPPPSPQSSYPTLVVFIGIYVAGRRAPPPQGRVRVPLPPCECEWGAWGRPWIAPPPVGVGWVVGVRLVSGFVENLSTLHLR